MKRILAACALALAALLHYSDAAQAQTTSVCGGMGYIGQVAGGLDAGTCYHLVVNSDGSIKTSSGGGGVAPAPYTPTVVAGTQRGLAIASATALTIPATATAALISVAGTNNTSGVCAYWQDDGTNPTNAAGQPLAAGAYLVYNAVGLPIKLIAASGATCTANISYYK